MGVNGAMPPKKFLEPIVFMCFERRFSKQNNVIRQKSNILAPKKNFGLATSLLRYKFAKIFYSAFHQLQLFNAGGIADTWPNQRKLVFSIRRSGSTF